MFVRKRTYRTKKDHARGVCYQLVESYREDGKVKQRVICNLKGHPSLEARLADVKAGAARWEERIACGDLRSGTSEAMYRRLLMLIRRIEMIRARVSKR